MITDRVPYQMILNFYETTKYKLCFDRLIKFRMKNKTRSKHDFDRATLPSDVDRSQTGERVFTNTSRQLTDDSVTVG